MPKRVMIFVDGSNFYHGMRDVLGRAGVDYGGLIKKLLRDRDLVRVYYYISMINRDEAEEQYRSQQRFLSYLQEIPYFQIKYGKLVRQGDTLVEKSIDVQIAVDMVRYAAQDFFDVAVLVSGDGDFAPAIDVTKDLGKHVEAVFFGQQTSQALRQSADLFIDLDWRFLEGCMLFREENGEI